VTNPYTNRVDNNGIHWGTLFFFILPRMEQNNIYMKAVNTGTASNSGSHSPGVFDQIIPGFLCPSDASAATPPGGCGVMQSDAIQRDGFASCDYAANVMVFDPRFRRNLGNAMADGTSNTVIIAERFRNCSPSSGGCTLPGWAWNTISNGGDGWTSPTFGAQDAKVVPSPPGGADLNQMNQGGATIAQGFQAGPSTVSCNWYATQGGHPGAMVIGMGDGSIRGALGNMKLTTWVAACTPNDGATLTDF